MAKEFNKINSDIQKTKLSGFVCQQNCNDVMRHIIGLARVSFEAAQNVNKQMVCRPVAHNTSASYFDLFLVRKLTHDTGTRFSLSIKQ